MATELDVPTVQPVRGSARCRLRPRCLGDTDTNNAKLVGWPLECVSIFADDKGKMKEGKLPRLSKPLGLGS